jgi:hypothetical protein
VREAKHERDRALADGEARLKLFESAVKNREEAVASRERETENMQKHLQAGMKCSNIKRTHDLVRNRLSYVHVSR